MKLKINGEEKDVESGLSVSALLESLDIKAELVAVEVNLNIIPRQERDRVTLKEGDEVEIVKFIGGGL